MNGSNKSGILKLLCKTLELIHYKPYDSIKRICASHKNVCWVLEDITETSNFNI